ncbi:hypothetical protein [Zhihengliuella salsuginis]|uniref:SGNH/GDSL hydrolase family protein n=1 Tax=Zhihengliuella salsuginis TaxID=578222 RepID=A0ABQ3GJX8_9MICC|nr:hypothetical protein [Zhihengliuella salsuginis]GHD11606.1 hypothetical protein GCM10008096_26190 [Zhihengliuella salsuginis]
MKIALIGNSHLGPIAPELAGLTRTDAYDVNATYFISRTYGQQQLKIVSGTHADIVEDVQLDVDNGVPDVLDTRVYDRFYVCGFQFSLIHLIEAVQLYQPESMSLDLAPQLLADSDFDDYVDHTFTTTTARSILDRLRAHTTADIVLVPAPHPARWVASDTRERSLAYGLLSENESAREFLLSQYQRQTKRISESGFLVAEQPIDTITDCWFTRDEYSLGDPNGSTRAFYERGDFYHMNRSYGNVYARQILNELTS